MIFAVLIQKIDKISKKVSIAIVFILFIETKYLFFKKDGLLSKIVIENREIKTIVNFIKK